MPAHPVAGLAAHLVYGSCGAAVGAFPPILGTQRTAPAALAPLTVNAISAGQIDASQTAGDPAASCADSVRAGFFFNSDGLP